MAHESEKKRSRGAFVAGALAVVTAAFVAVSASADGGWAPYVRLMMKDSAVESAAIRGRDGSSWAHSATFPAMSSVQAQDLVAGMKDNARFEANGMLIGADKFVFTGVTSDVCAVGRRGQTSLLICLTKKALLVALTNDGSSPMQIARVELVQNEMNKNGF